MRKDCHHLEIILYSIFPYMIMCKSEKPTRVLNASRLEQGEPGKKTVDTRGTR